MDWTRFDDIRPGDRIRVPGGSSRALWDSRASAMASSEPFRIVSRTEVHDLDLAYIHVWFADRTYIFVPRQARALRDTEGKAT